MKLSRRGFLSGLAAAVTLRLAPVYGGVAAAPRLRLSGVQIERLLYGSWVSDPYPDPPPLSPLAALEAR